MTRAANLPRPAARRGVAALTVVMVLFFVMALVAAYTNRNLVFEQRISANSYRATRALEAAEAGVEWTLAMLNGGRVDASCNRPPAAAAAAVGDFRSRYLAPAVSDTFGEGGFDLTWSQTPANRRHPACIFLADGRLNCICPAAGEAPADIQPPADGIGSAFRVTLMRFNSDDISRAGAIQFITHGCANPGEGNRSCYAQNFEAPSVDSATALISTVGLVRALPVAPPAVLTAGGSITTTPPWLITVSNQDLASGYTVHAGSALNPADFTLHSVRQDGRGLVDDDAALRTLRDQGEEAWFRAQFKLDIASYGRQPATVRLDCAAGCDGAAVAAALLLNPRNPIWADGNVNLDAAGALGSAADPMMLIVAGNLTISADVQVTGFVHARQIAWASETATWTGALVTPGNFAATSAATLEYSKAALDIIRLRYGSFVRAPGSWNLY